MTKGFLFSFTINFSRSYITHGSLRILFTTSIAFAVVNYSIYRTFMTSCLPCVQSCTCNIITVLQDVYLPTALPASLFPFQRISSINYSFSRPNMQTLCENETVMKKDFFLSFMPMFVCLQLLLMGDKVREPD